MLRDQLLNRLAAMGPKPDYVALARDILALRVSDAALARRIVEQALVVEDRRAAWRRLGKRACAGLPERPGIYIMRDAHGEAVYVGKAADLRRRVSSYFAPNRWKSLPPGLTSATRVEWEPVGSELEALLREADLIARLAPRVNVQQEASGRPLRRRPHLVRDVIVVVPSVEDDSAELVCASADGRVIVQRTRRSGADLAVHARRVAKFFPACGAAALSLNARGDRASALSAHAPIVFGWLAGRGREASRLDPHDCISVAALRARLEALLRDADLFAGRIDQRK